MATIAEQLVQVNTTKHQMKAAIENKGIDMTDVPLTSYATKINEIELNQITPIYSYGTWNSDYPYATYIPSGASITFNDSTIKMVGGGAVPQIGFTLKDEDVGRMFYALIMPSTWSNSSSSNYRFGMGYQSTAVTSSSGGSTSSDSRIVPYHSLSVVAPSIIGLPALKKYVKIFVGSAQTANVYKIWLGEKYVALPEEESTWVSKTGELAVASSFATTNGTGESALFKFDTPIRNFSGTMVVQGSGGDATYRQFGTEIYCYTDVACTKYTPIAWQYVTNTSSKTVNFSLTDDTVIYGIKYTVWSADASSGTNLGTNTCTSAKITSWEQQE